MKDKKYRRGWWKTKIRLQSRATEKYHEQTFEEMEELEEKKSKEALPLVQKKHILMRYQNERDEARRLQRSGSSRGTRKEADLQDLLSFESCRSSAVEYIEEISTESPRKMQDEQEVTSEAPWSATGGKEEDGWRLEPEGETDTPETNVLWDGVEGVPGYPDGEGRHEQVQGKSSRKESEAPWEEGEEVQRPKRKVIRVESEETQDYVREEQRVRNMRKRKRGPSYRARSAFHKSPCFVATVDAVKRPSVSGSLRWW